MSTHSLILKDLSVAFGGNKVLEGVNISFTEISMLMLLTCTPTIAASPMDTATDTVSAKPSTMLTICAMSSQPSNQPPHHLPSAEMAALMAEQDVVLSF